MPHNEDDKKMVIPVDHIHETFMPPYEYQKPQNGFGSISSNQSQDPNQDTKKSDTKSRTTSKP